MIFVWLLLGAVVYAAGVYIADVLLDLSLDSQGGGGDDAAATEHA